MTESHPRSEVEAAVATYLEHREAVDRGEAEWGTVAQFFTDEAVFIDAAWGRHEGPEAIGTMMTAAMAGLDGFSYPTDVVAIEGDDVLIAWRQVVAGSRARRAPARAHRRDDPALRRRGEVLLRGGPHERRQGGHRSPGGRLGARVRLHHATGLSALDSWKITLL